MPQLQLPIFQEGVTLITPELGYLKEDGKVVYLHGMLPVFTHEVTDTASFKMIVSQLYHRSRQASRNRKSLRDQSARP